MAPNRPSATAPLTNPAKSSKLPPMTSASIAASLPPRPNYDEAALVPEIGRIAARHQTVARLMALGESTAAIGQATGYSLAHIRNLRSDAAFCELLEGWRKQTAKAFDGVALKVRDAASGAVDEFNRRLELEPLEISTKDLLKGAEVFLDRAGYGPSSVIEVKDIRASIVKDLPSIEDGVLIEDSNGADAVSALDGDPDTPVVVSA